VHVHKSPIVFRQWFPWLSGCRGPAGAVSIAVADIGGVIGKRRGGQQAEGGKKGKESGFHDGQDLGVSMVADFLSRSPKKSVERLLNLDVDVPR